MKIVDSETEANVRMHINAAIDALVKALAGQPPTVPPSDPRYAHLVSARQTYKHLVDARGRLDVTERSGRSL